MKNLKTKSISFFMYGLLCVLIMQAPITIANYYPAYCHGHTCDCNKPKCTTKKFKFGHNKVHHFRLNCKPPYPLMQSASKHGKHIICAYKSKTHYQDAECYNTRAAVERVHFHISCKK